MPPRWRRTLPRAVALLALGVLVALFAATAKQYRISSGGGTLPAIVDPAFTPADIARLAAGEEPGGGQGENALIAALLSAPETVAHGGGEFAIDVGYAPGESSRTDIWTIGWPNSWITRASTRNYDDAPRREGFRPAVTDHAAAPIGKYEMPRDPLHIPPRALLAWYGDAVSYQPPPEETGGVDTTTRVAVFTPAVFAGAIIGVWYISGLAWWLAGRLRGRRADARRARAVLAGGAGAAILIAGLLNQQQVAVKQFVMLPLNQVGVPPTPVYWSRPGFVRLPWTRAQLECMREQPGADREVAAKIAELLPAGATEHSTVYLAAAQDAESQYAEPGCTMTSLNPTLPLAQVLRLTFVRRPDFGPAEFLPTPPGLRTVSSWGSVGLEFSTGRADHPTYRLLINPEIAGAVIVGLWLVHRISAVLLGALWRRRARRRRRAGRCPECGYAVAAA